CIVKNDSSIRAGDIRDDAGIGPCRSSIAAYLKCDLLETISAATAREADRLDVIDSRHRGESHHDIQISLPRGVEAHADRVRVGPGRKVYSSNRMINFG